MLHHAAKVAFMLLCCMKTVKDVFTEFRQGLNKMYDTNEPEAITLMAVSEISDLSKAKIKAFPELELPKHQIEKLANILTQLKTGKPIQYILGRTEFYGLPFNVNSSVLIPRPETEELVEWVLSSVGSRQLTAGSGQSAVSSEQLVVGSILDIGTGSGCIAISLKKNLPNVKVSAIDISPDALKTAKANAILNEVDIEFIEADILYLNSETAKALLSPTENKQLRKIEIPKFEIIISNPPYVTQHDKTQMHTNVTDFEPYTALFVPENDPLIFYKAIADFASLNLCVNGLLFLEINENYGKQIVDLLEHKRFINIELKKDMSGRDRMIKASFV
jgi:release factor glutamine methyltransferase